MYQVLKSLLNILLLSTYDIFVFTFYRKYAKKYINRPFHPEDIKTFFKYLLYEYIVQINSHHIIINYRFQ